MLVVCLDLTNLPPTCSAYILLDGISDETVLDGKWIGKDVTEVD
jgi:hypothetical protein